MAVDSNRFRFKSFSDRLNEIDIRKTVFYHIGHEYEDYSDDISETYFHQALKQWSVQNLTDEYNKFFKKCYNIVTLPQLIHEKESVVNLLLEKISIETPIISLQPFLELLYVLAKDLRDEYFPYVDSILKSLIQLLLQCTRIQKHDNEIADCIEWTLSCLAYLFKYLKTFFKQNLRLVFNSITPILDEMKQSSEIIINFAIECFSFIVRDIKDFQKLFDVIEVQFDDRIDNNDKKYVSACGRLIFELCNGINNNFHNVTERLFDNLFDVLLQINRNHELWFDIITLTIEHILLNIKSNSSQLLWEIISQKIYKCLQQINGNSSNDCTDKQLLHSTAIQSLIRLLTQMIVWRNGKFLVKTDSVTDVIVKILDKVDNGKILKLTSNLICQILLSENIKLTQWETRLLTRRFFKNITERYIFDEFIRNICTHSQFDFLCLPNLMNYIQSFFDKNSMKLLVYVLLKKSPLYCFQRYGDSDAWKRCNLIRFEHETKQIFINTILKFEFVDCDESDLNQFLYGIIISPHLKAIDDNIPEILMKLKQTIKSVCDRLNTDEIKQQEIVTVKRTNYRSLAILLENFIRISSSALMQNNDDEFIWEICEIILKHQEPIEYNLMLLRILDFIFTQKLKNQNHKFIQQKIEENFSEIQLKFSNCLCSPNHDVRLISTRILAILSKSSMNLNCLSEVYELFYNVEKITPTVQTYRDQLLFLQKLSPDCEFFKTTISTNAELRMNSLRFLIGTLYQNFKLLWEPVQKIIEEYYLNCLKVDEYWDIYKIKLEETALIVRGERLETNQIIWNLMYQADDETAEDDDFNEFIERDKDSSTVNYNNYRNLLWSGMSNFGVLPEVKNREIVTIFMEFVNKEYRRTQEKNYLTWNITTSTTIPSQYTIDINDDNDEETYDNIEQNTSTRSERKQDHQKFDKNLIATLLIKLNVFSKMANPKQLYNESELYEFYLELLMSVNNQLQKAALNCILAYKYKFLMPYKDHLFAFLDEKQFKSELINFNINENDENQKSIIQFDHRPNFMVILLRLLYGRMMSKTTKNLSNQLKKNLIMSFLNGCRKNEVLWFLKMAFNQYNEILESCQTIEEIPKEVQRKIQFNRIWSPKLLQQTINLLELAEKQFGILMDEEFLTYVLKIKIFIASICNQVIIEHNSSTSLSEINAKILKIFRVLHSNCFLNLIEFFDHFQSIFMWTDSQIGIVFDVFVWQYLKKLPSDCIHRPTPLLKLFLVWSHNPKYFSLFLRKMKTTAMTVDGGDEGEDLTPMQSILNVLMNEKAQPNIHMSIMEIIERLLMHNDDIKLEIDQVSGYDVIRPYVSQILKKIHQIILGKSSKPRKNRIDKRLLFILSKLTELVHESEICHQLLEILLPIFIGTTLTSTNHDENTSLQAIQTISNLMKNINGKVKYIRTIAPLFERIIDAAPRKLLCKLLKQITVDDASLKFNIYAELMDELNAWDKRWIEQPDYNRRLNAFKRIKSILNRDSDKRQTMTVDLGILIIYNCFYFIKFGKDMAMRDAASEHLKCLLPKLVKTSTVTSKDIDYLLNDVFLSFVQKELRNQSNDVIRNEIIQLLGEITRQCWEHNAILKDLKLLTDNINPECDFFDNITHLQIHRHGVALLKFCSIYRKHGTTYDLPNTKTLTGFIVPLAKSHLFQEKSARNHILIDAAIETIAIACRLLPWHQYQMYLRYYLHQMIHNRTYQKQLVRLIIGILDAFHFDLSTTAIVSDEADVEIDEKSDIDDNDEDSDEETIAIPQHQPVTPNLRKRIIQTIKTILIPKLYQSLTEKMTYESKHKINRRKISEEREAEESLRIPLGLAIVKLLQKLPKEMLESNIQSIFIKVCHYLKSPLKSVRMLARDNLKMIIRTLNGEYLEILVHQMKSLLTRGFEVHVLSATIHGILDRTKNLLKPGAIEKCFMDILDICLNDIFGDVSAEKEVSKIVASTPEAKPNAKSYLTLSIIANNIQQQCLLDLLMPFKVYLANNHSKKDTQKIQECFQKIITGLTDNENLSIESLLIFIHGTTSESIPDLMLNSSSSSEQQQQQTIKKQSAKKTDCFLIPEEPKSRAGIQRYGVRRNVQANAHILIEFGLEMLYILLKRKKLDEIDYSAYLNPFSSILLKCLQSSYVRVTTLTLKCLTSICIHDYKIDTLEPLMDEIVEIIFKILHKNSTIACTKKDDNYNLVRSSFKSIASILKKFTKYKMTPDKYQKLLFYIEQDIYENDKQPTAFSLLKSILNKKINMVEIHNLIMDKICELSIKAESDYVRVEARQIIKIYTIEYPRYRKIDGIINFYSSQLNYELPSGRMSALQFILMILNRISPDLLIGHYESLFFSLGLRFVNEDSTYCRQLIAECLVMLLSKLDIERRGALFNTVLLFLKSEKIELREMGASLCTRFVEYEKSEFIPKLKDILPILASRLCSNAPNAPGRLVRAAGIRNDDADNIDPIKQQQMQRSFDHELIAIQNCILKIVECCPNILEIITRQKLSIHFDEIAYNSKSLLAHEHQWVRMNSLKILEKILSILDHNMIYLLLMDIEPSDYLYEQEFIYSNAPEDIKSLVLDLCAQLIPGATEKDVAELVMRNLLYVATMLKDIPIQNNQNDTTTAAVKNENKRGNRLNLHWLLKIIRNIIHKEVAEAPHSIVLRTAIFNWIEGLITLVDVNQLRDIAHHLLQPLLREMNDSDQHIDKNLQNQARSLTTKLRKRLETDFYDNLVSKLQQQMLMRKVERRTALAQEKILDPVRATKRKAATYGRKKSAKKLKADIKRGKVGPKRARQHKTDSDD